jgi:hypothetical protein
MVDWRTLTHGHGFIWCEPVPSTSHPHHLDVTLRSPQPPLKNYLHSSSPSWPHRLYCDFTVTKGGLKVMPPVLNFTLFTSWTCENFTEFHYKIAEGIVIFQCSFNRCRQSSTFEQEHVFPPGKSCSPSASTGAQHSAVPRYWRNNVIAGFLSKEQTGDNLMVRCQDCRVDVATVSIQKFWWHTYVLPRFVLEEQHFIDTFIVGRTRRSWAFRRRIQYSSRSSLLSPQ